MSPDPLLSGLALKIAGPILAYITKTTLAKLSHLPPIKKAIYDTDEEFPTIEGVAYNLELWVNSLDFQRIIDEVQVNPDLGIDDKIVDSFVDKSAFHFGDETNTNANKIIEIFLINLNQQFLSGPYADYYIGMRQTNYYYQLKKDLMEVKEELLEKFDFAKSIEDDDDNVIDENNKALAKAIDVIRNQIGDKFNPRHAIDALSELVEECASVSDPNPLLYRIENNIGVCYMQLRDYEEAKKRFSTALKYKPEDAIALGNLSACHLISGEYALANKKAVQALMADRANEQALGVIFQVLAKEEKWGEIDQTAELHNIETAHLQTVLGFISCGRGRYQEGIDLFRKALEIDSDNVVAKRNLADALLNSKTNNLNRPRGLPWFIQIDTKYIVEEASSLYTECIDGMVPESRKSDYIDCLLNRSTTYIYLNKLDLALRDCQNAIILEPDSMEVQKRIMNIHMLKSDFDQFCIEYESSNERDIQVENAINYSIACNEIGRNVNCSKHLTKLIEAGDDGKVIIELAQANNYLNWDKISEAKSILSEINKEAEKEYYYYHIKSILHHKIGEIDNAKEVLLSAIEKLPELYLHLLEMRLGDLHFSHALYFDAANWYEKARKEVNDPEVDTRFAVALLNSGDYRKALSFAQTVRKEQGKVVKGISEVEARVHEYLGNLDDALEMYQSLTKLEPENSEHVIRISEILIRKGDEQSALELIKESMTTYMEDIEYRFKASQILYHCGEQFESIKMLYEIRREKFDDHLIHSAYIGAFLQLPENVSDALQQEQVGLDSAIVLKESDKQRVYVLESSPPFHNSRNEIDNASDFAETLLGKQINDKIEVARPSGNKYLYTIVGIKSKYVNAFQESLTHAEEWFPEHSPMESVKLDTDEGSVFRSMLEERYKLGQKALEGYREKKYGIAIFAKMIGLNVIEAYETLIGVDEGIIVCAVGNDQEKNNADIKLSSASSICLDISGLLTLHLLDVFEMFFERFDEVYYSQHLLDAINENIEKLKYAKEKGQGSLGYGPNGPFFTKSTPSTINTKIEQQESLKTYLIQKCSKRTSTSILELDNRLRDDLDTALGRCSLQSLGIAKGLGTILLTDDLAVNHIGMEIFNVYSVPTYYIINDCLKYGLIDKKAYSSMVVKLVGAGFDYTPIDADAFAFLLSRDGYKMESRDAEKAFSVIANPTTTESSAIAIIAQFIKHVYLSKATTYEKNIILSNCLKTLCLHRNYQSIIKNLAVHLKANMILLPIHLSEIKRAMESWVKVEQENIVL